MNSQLVCTDVLALRCIDDFVFVGMGYTLHIFNRRTGKLAEKIQALYPCNIHGIVKGPDNKVAVYGATRVRVYDVFVDSGQIRLTELYGKNDLPDWIITMEWLSMDNLLMLVILFAHNSIEIYDISGEWKLRVNCDERCILYGGCISIGENAEVAILSGTVFQEILIWEVKRDASWLKNAPVLHRLAGHNGVIFSIAYDRSAQLICSTSDDRTVRLWEVSAEDSEARRTPLDNIGWKRKKVKLIKTMFGHTARVWRSVIRNRTVITVGEDSLICTWSFTGKLLGKVYGHGGAAIWSMEVSDGEILLTGGADGAVRTLSLKTNETEAAISLPSDTGVRATAKYICYLNSGSLIIYEEGGHVLRYEKDKKKAVDGYRLRGSSYLSRYSRCYCIMRVSPCRFYVAFASDDGYVAVYKEPTGDEEEEQEEEQVGALERTFEEKVMETGILSLHWLENDATMIACGSGGVVKVFNFTRREGLGVSSIRSLPPSRERWLTAATTYRGDLLVCADRAGSLHVYDLKSTAETSPVQTLAKVHGRIGVQTFAVLDGKLMSAGRDGTLRFYESRKLENGTRVLCKLHDEKMPMDWIGGSIKIGGDTLILGFREAEFLVYSISERRIVWRVACGGGHRSWDFFHFDEESIAFAYIRSKRVFALHSRLPCFRGSTVLLNGFHAKEACCAEALTNLNGERIFLSGGEDTSVRLTSISWAPLERIYKFRTLCVLDGHLSSVKCITSAKQGKYVADEDEATTRRYLVFSAGARAQIKAWEIEISGNVNAGGELLGKDVSCTDLATHLLYGLDQQRGRKHYEIQPETRYMDIGVFWPRGSINPLVFVGCADGRFRIFAYETDKRAIHLKATVRYVDRCILKISVISVHQGSAALVLTMSTDGVARFFYFPSAEISRLLSGTIISDSDLSNNRTPIGERIRQIPITEHSLHQSGINSFDLRTIGEGEYLLATGGDDNVLNLARFHVSPAASDKDFSITLRFSWKFASAHAAQITGLRFDATRNRVYSVGIDQQIITYEYEYLEDGTLSANIINRRYTAIPDVQGLVLFPSSTKKETEGGEEEEEEESLACVYGKGFELFSFLRQ